MRKPALTIADPTVGGTQPPRKLGAAGRQLWDQILAEYSAIVPDWSFCACQRRPQTESSDWPARIDFVRAPWNGLASTLKPLSR